MMTLNLDMHYYYDTQERVDSQTLVKVRITKSMTIFSIHKSFTDVLNSISVYKD